jgi:transcriptional regulator with XRE-family HTH domain
MFLDLQAIGHEIRRSRLARGLTQAQLAAAANITRTTLNQLENGLVKDLGIRKVQAILEQLGLALIVERRSAKTSDFLRLASTAASVSFKTTLSERELLHALLTGKISPARRPHLRTLLEESRPALLKGLIQQVSRWSTPGKVERNLTRLAAAVGLPEGSEKWLTTTD